MFNKEERGPYSREAENQSTGSWVHVFSLASQARCLS